MYDSLTMHDMHFLLYPNIPQGLVIFQWVEEDRVLQGTGPMSFFFVLVMPYSLLPTILYPMY